MDRILKEITNREWWVSVVLVGLIINLASAYLKPPIDKSVERYSKVIKQKNEKKKLLFKEDVQELLNDPSKATDLQLDILYFNLRAVLWLAISLVMNNVLIFPLDIIFAMFPFMQALSMLDRERYLRSVLKEYKKSKKLNP